MFSRKEKRSKLLTKYIKINFLVIFLPVMLSSIVYCITIQKNYREMYLDTIEYTVNEKVWQLENRIDTFEATAQQISLDKEMTPYMLNSLDYSTVNATRRLKSFLSETVYFQELAICLNDSEKVYTSRGIVDIDTFVEKTICPTGDFSAEEFKEYMVSKKYFDCTKQGQNVLFGAYECNVVTYPLGKTEGSFYGTLIGVYVNDWEKIFAEEKSDDRIVIVCTDNLEMLYTQIADEVEETIDFREPLSALLINLDAKEKYHEFTLNGVTYVGKVVHSEVCNWYVIDMVKERVIISNLLIMYLPMLIIIFLSMLLLIIFLSIVLSVYNYKPVRHLYNLFDGRKPEKDQENEKDELIFLNEYIRNLLNEQSAMEAQFETNRKISRMELIRKLLKGNLDIRLSAVRERMEHMGVSLDKDYLAAIVIKSSEKNCGLILKNVLQESEYGNFYLTENIYKEYDALLACVDGQDELIEFSECLLNYAKDDTKLQLGIGNSYGSAESLKYSLMEAVIAVESGNEKIVYFSDITKRKDNDFYCKPLESELKLKQLLIQESAEQMDEVLNELHKELLHVWQTNSDTVLLFLMNRIISVLFENAVSLKENMGEKYLHYTNLEEFLEQVREFCNIELNCRLEKKASKEDSRIKNIIEFVDENYMNQEMSLTLVADKFDMTGSYFSRIFKAAMGKTFINYVMDKRMELAAKFLIETDDQIGEIVEKVGYSDVASFTRKFTRYFLTSPGNYRKIEREKIKSNAKDF